MTLRKASRPKLQTLQVPHLPRKVTTAPVLEIMSCSVFIAEVEPKLRTIARCSIYIAESMRRRNTCTQIIMPATKSHNSRFPDVPIYIAESMWRRRARSESTMPAMQSHTCKTSHRHLMFHLHCGQDVLEYKYSKYHPCHTTRPRAHAHQRTL